MLEVYAESIKYHVAENIEDLEELYQILEQRNWTRIERKGAERTLQTLIESCIGVSKQWLKQKYKVIPSDAYQAILKVAEHEKSDPKQTENWRKIIGMRNAIVHDYLNLDDKIIKAVVRQKMYIELQQYVNKLADELTSPA